MVAGVTTGDGGSGDRRPADRRAEQRGSSGTRPGRRALFSDPSGETGIDAGRRDLPEGRRALFTPAGAEQGERTATAVVHCRTCLASTPMSLPAVTLALIPSLWLPTRPWPRLMRCPACHRVAWCRIDWPGPF